MSDSGNPCSPALLEFYIHHLSGAAVRGVAEGRMAEHEIPDFIRSKRKQVAAMTQGQLASALLEDLPTEQFSHA